MIPFPVLGTGKSCTLATLWTSRDTSLCLEGGVLGKYNIAIKDKEILLELGISLLS